MKRAVSGVMLALLVTGTFGLAFVIQPIAPVHALPPLPGVGAHVSLYINDPAVQYVNSSDYFYVRHGHVLPNWTSYTVYNQTLFLDPQQTNFTLQTSATNFQNPSMTQFTYYDSANDSMYSLFWFQFLPGDLAPGNYSFTGTWSWANEYEPLYEQRTITLVVNQLSLTESGTFVSCVPNPVSIGWPVTCTATVSGSNPTGTVTWSTSSIFGEFIPSSNSTLSNGTCSTVYAHNLTESVTITASYSGDSNNAPSIGSTTLIVTSGGPIYYTQNYTSVQATIDDAPTGATVIIASGLYSESLTVNKTLTIIGDAPPIFSGGGSGIAMILLAGASGSIITGIMITSWDQGILINNASNCKIYNNIMSLMNNGGIVLQGANAVNNKIYGNTFQQDAVAVHLTSLAYNSTVSQNIISLSSTGLKIENGGNTIYANIMSQNQVGINITSSINNKIFHNSFEGNTIQAAVSMSTGNVWDDGYPSGGNYWSSYAGVDENSGPYQSVMGSDGIGDQPYAIAANNTDRYPLMKPWTATADHSVAVISVMTTKTVIGQGFNCDVTVNVVNSGAYAETFRVIAYANAVTISFQQVSNLNVMSPLLLTFTWNTTNLPKGNYTLSAYAWPVQNETSISDNNLTGGTIYLGTPGDLNGDGTVDIYDAIMLAGAFNSNPGSLKWNSDSDVNNDNTVDIYDAIILAGNFGKTAVDV